MPLSFENTWLWRRAFVEPFEGADAEEQTFFRAQFLAMRELVKPLVARVMRDMPGYTVHDVTHLDALWETASLLAKDGITLNPPEAFVFGGAVLLHDAAMTLAAYPNGIADLQESLEWADTAAAFGASVETADPDTLAKIAVEVLRMLHAPKAVELATQGWTSAEHPDEKHYLIEPHDLRHFYGPTIGTIAHSHWWSISQVERNLNRHLGAMPPHTSHSVDILKVACLLRVADAIHLDRRRAPPFVRAIDRPMGISGLHWGFQSRLGFPRVEDDALVFAASEAFGVSDAESWWLGFDAFSMADRELRDTDLLLRDTGRGELTARRVKGILNPADMATHIPVSGWKPIETRVHVSDIPHIIQTLGGSKLYGQDASAPVRELIQNGMDAIQARRRLEDRGPDWGQITVELREEGGEFWLSVEDNGVGMSERVLTGALLDFGSSFWKSSQVSSEFPGLTSKGMASIGRFGIGFFAVFMLGDLVRVTSRRYDKSQRDALMLTFKSGLHARPILTPAAPRAAPIDGGTKVEVRLRSNPRRYGTTIRFLEVEEDEFDLVGDTIPSEFPSLAALAAWIAPMADVSIRTIQFGEELTAVAANDWKEIAPATLFDRISSERGYTPRSMVELVRPIEDDQGHIYGRAAIYAGSIYWDHTGALCASGIRLQGLASIIGVIDGRVSTAARNAGSFAVPPAALTKWANGQARLLERADLDGEMKAECAELILRCGGSIRSLPVARFGGSWLNQKELKEIISSKDIIQVLVGDVTHEDHDEVGADTFHNTFKMYDNIFWMPSVESKIFPPTTTEPENSDLFGVFMKILENSWKSFEAYEDADFAVGKAGSEEIVRLVWQFERDA